MGNNCCETILDGKTSLTESVLYNKCPLLLVFCSHIHIYFTTGELISIDYHSNLSMNSVPNIIKISEVAVPTYMYMQEGKLYGQILHLTKDNSFLLKIHFRHK